MRLAVSGCTGGGGSPRATGAGGLRGEGHCRRGRGRLARVGGSGLCAIWNVELHCNWLTLWCLLYVLSTHFYGTICTCIDLHINMRTTIHNMYIFIGRVLRFF